MKYDIEFGGDTYEIDAPDETSLRKAINKLRLQVATEASVGAAQAGAEARRDAPPTIEEQPFDPTGLQPVVPGLSQDEQNAAMFEGYGRGVRESAPVAAGAVALPVLAANAPAIGAFLASPAGGATMGALPGIREGDPIAAAKGAAYGAGTSGILGQAGKILPFLLRLGTGAKAAKAVKDIAPVVTEAVEAAAPVAARTAAPAVASGAGRKAFEAQSAELAKMLGQTGAQTPVAAKVLAQAAPGADEAALIANQLRKVAEQSSANKALVMEGIKRDFAEYGFPTWQAMRDYVFKARTTMPTIYLP